MDVSIIIVNYNTLKLTRKCIDSIWNKTEDVLYEIIVVDNASTDGSREFFSKESRIKYIYNNENVGFGRANNIGAKIAKGDYLFLLNSDTYLLNNAIYMLWSKIKELNRSNQRVACMGCMLYSEDGDIIHSYSRFPSMRRSIYNYSFQPIAKALHMCRGKKTVSNYDYNLHNESCFDVETITGADLMIDHAVYEACGLFDEGFFMYFEETEMQYRYMKNGYRRIIYKLPKIVHLEGKSNKICSPKRAFIIIRSMFLYFEKTHTRMSYITFRVIFKVCYVISHILGFPFTNGTLAEKGEHIKEIVKL